MIAQKEDYIKSGVWEGKLFQVYKPSGKGYVVDSRNSISIVNKNLPEREVNRINMSKYGAVFYYNTNEKSDYMFYRFYVLTSFLDFNYVKYKTLESLKKFYADSYEV